MRIVYTGTREPPEVDGAELSHLPMLERISLPLPADLSERLGAPDRQRHAVFYSRSAAERVLDEVDATAFEGVDVWAVGARTAAWLSAQLDREVRSPDEQNFEGLVAELPQSVAPDDLVVSFELAGTERRLDEAGLDAEVWSVPVYETLPCHWEDFDALLRRIDPKWVVFASPRAWQAFSDNLQQRTVGDSYRVAVIGPSTCDEIDRLGGRVDLISRRPDVESLLREILEQ